jgi:hypothetical protein
MKMRSGFLCTVILFAMSLASWSQDSAAVPAKPAQAPANRTAAANYGKLPMTFEPNVGQTASAVRFLSRGSGYTVYLTAGEMVFSAHSSKVSAQTGSSQTASPQAASPQTAQSAAAVSPSPTPNTVIRLGMVGANPNPVAVGENQQAGKANYFIGNDKSKWHTNVAMYGKVRYKNIYPGIDLVYYGNPSQMEYDFELAPGADPNQIQFDVKGAESVSIDGGGNLVLQTKQGSLQMRSPVLYQTFNNMKIPITGGYAMKSSTRVAFSVNGYDKSKPLVIDPVLLYATYLGGLADDSAAGVAVDASGSAYIAGWTQSTNFPVASEGYTNQFNTIAFVAKLDVSGSSLVYADFIGATYDYGTAVALDSNNDVYITGYTCSVNFPIVNGYQTEMNGCFDGFVSKISPDGSTLLYSTYLGGSNGTYPYGIAVNAAQEFYVAGTTYSTDFPMQSAYQSSVLPNAGPYYGQYGFVTHFTADGSALVFSTYLAGNTNVVEQCYYGPCWPSPNTIFNGIALDGNGNAYVGGTTNTYNFPTTSGAYLTSENLPDNQQIGVVAEFSATGALTYSTYFGSVVNYPTSVTAIAVDGNGSAYITGTGYADGNFPETSPNLCDQTVIGWACGYGYVTKLDPTGSTLVYSTFLPPNNYGSPQAITLDSQNDAYVAGYSNNNTMTLMNPIEAYTNQQDIVLTEIDPTGSIELFGTFIGGNGNDTATGIAVDASGSMYVVGNTDSSDFPVTSAALQNTLGGNQDTFVAKIGTDSAPAVAISPSLVQFSIRPVGSVSQPNTSLLRNMGSAPLTINSITISGDFTETDTCGTGVAAASTCTFTVTFTPTAPGPRFGSILVQDNGAGSPHFINLVGDGSTSIASLSATSLTFPSLQVNQSSSAQSVTLTNNGNATLNISNIAISGDYAQTNNCPTALGIGSSCTFQITFTPTAGGASNGALTLTDDAPSSPQTVSLSGSGYVTTTSISPASLTFNGQSIGTTSASQPVTITNTGANPMTVSTVSASGDFAATTQCTSIAASQSCTVNVTFTPTASGSRTGTLTISDNAQGNPHTVSLSGTGIAAAANFSATSLLFASQAVGTVSAPQTITLTNSGNGQLSVTGVQVTGDFSQTNNCSTVAANGGSCIVQVTFAPTATGSRTGTLVFTDSAPNSPQTISLSGTAGAPANTLSASSLTFPSQQIGTTSPAQSITLTNTGSANMSIASISAVGDFSQTNNCPANIVASVSCTINVTFTPAIGGTRTGQLIISDNSLSGPALVSLSGTGSDFSLTANGNTSATVTAGSTATYAMTFTGVGGPFANTVHLACSGAPALSTCTVSPATVAAGSTSASVTVTVTTTAPVASLSLPGEMRGRMFLATWGFHVPGFLFLGMLSLGGRKNRKKWQLLLLALVIGLALFAVACGGASMGTNKTTQPTPQPGTTNGTYTLVVTGTSGSLIHSTELSLTVQ